MKPTIPIFFTFDQNYVLAACVAFHSLLAHASKDYRYHLYIVHTGLTAGHIRRIRRVTSRFANAEVSFRQAPDYDTAWEKLRHKAHFSQEIFYKLTAAEMFPEYDRILFSDVDVIFTGDISPSYFLYPDERFYFAGPRPILRNTSLPHYVRDFTAEEIKIINENEVSAGYMLINLKCLREDRKQPELTDFFRRNIHRLILPEQDCIALCCTPYIRFMPYEYVVCAFLYHLPQDKLVFNTNNPLLSDYADGLKEFRRMLAEAVQLHYPGGEKPWNNPTVYKYKEWLKACIAARQLGYYLSMQPVFLRQRIRRYNLKRFVRKLKRRFR